MKIREIRMKNEKNGSKDEEWKKRSKDEEGKEGK